MTFVYRWPCTKTLADLLCDVLESVFVCRNRVHETNAVFPNNSTLRNMTKCFEVAGIRSSFRVLTGITL